ncbi:hypothetical protein Hte_006937 [Hypoxylon texense]
MSIQAWATNARSSTEHQTPESQRLVDAYGALLEGKSTPEESACSISAVLEPLIKRDPNDLRIASVWGLFCGAMRHVGSDQTASKRLLDLLNCISMLQVKNDHGNDIKHEWGGRFWADLPMYGLMSREYDKVCFQLLTETDIKPDEGMDISDWVGQKSCYFNAAPFAAVFLAGSPGSLAWHIASKTV